jgi:hypothetical protein
MAAPPPRHPYRLMRGPSLPVCAPRHVHATESISFHRRMRERERERIVYVCVCVHPPHSPLLHSSLARQLSPTLMLLLHTQLTSAAMHDTNLHALHYRRLFSSHTHPHNAQEACVNFSDASKHFRVVITNHSANFKYSHKKN